MPNTAVVGVANNVEFLGRLVATRSFADAELDTALIEREHDALFPAPAAPPDAVFLIAALAEAERAARASQAAAPHGLAQSSPWRRLDAWRLNGRGWWRMGFRSGEVLREVDVAGLPQGGWELELDGQRSVASASLACDGELHGKIGDRRVAAAVIAQGDRRHVFFDGRTYVFGYADALGVAGDAHEEEGSGLVSPMPGKVIALLAAPGAAVAKGAPLLVLEAMKMEHTISAPHAGTVKRFRFAAGDQVAEGVELVEFE